MKHKFLSLVTIGLLAVVSCTQEDSFLESRITHVSAELPDFMEENGTRSQINVSASDGISYSWAIGDVLGIFPDEGDQVSFRLTESSLSADGKNATFDGGAWALKNGHTYYSYFPFSYENFSESSSLSAIPVDYIGQSITEWGDTKNAGRYDFNAAGGTSSNSGALSFSFQRLGALLRVKLTLPATATYQKLTLSTDADVIPVKGKVNLSASTIAYIPQTYASEISVNLNNISGSKDQATYVYLMLPPMTLLTQNKLLTATLLYNNGSSATYVLCKSGDTTPHTPDFKANTIYKRDAVPQGFNPGGEMSGGDEEGGDGIENGHAYVDLGLPSGTLWATCNVGATSPEGYGDYFAWGETAPQTEYIYSWATYKYCNGNSTSMTKYCDSSTYGMVDNKQILEGEDDAATTLWGNSWCTPTSSQWKELKQQCKWEWTTENGVYGCKITGQNGNSIFLSAGGQYSDSSFRPGSPTCTYAGCYWASNIQNNIPYNIDFDKYGIYIDNNGVPYRYYGALVRAVIPGSQESGGDPDVSDVIDIKEGVYYLKNTSVYGAEYLYESGNLLYSEEGIDLNTYSAKWRLEKMNSGYSIQNVTTGNYMNTECRNGSLGADLVQMSTGETPEEFFFSIQTVYGIPSGLNLIQSETMKKDGLYLNAAGWGSPVGTYNRQEDDTSGWELILLSEEPETNYSDHDCVDLGLSVKWATCNVGASSPEEYGDYYAWGETETKDIYDWSTYKWCNGSSSTLTKYCTSNSYGTVDNKGVLDPEDDVAQVKWGGNWRMPTDAEMTELRENCTWTWTTQGGKDGYKVTGSNGNSIFLPAAGNRYDSSLGDAGSNGDYWSSSLYTSSPSGAWSVGFYSDVYRNGSGRYYGRSVRAVQNETPAAPATTGTAKATINSVDTDVNWVQLWKDGPKFAEYNVGATSETDCGGYYAWGGSQNKVDDHNTGNTGEGNLSGADDTATKLWGEKWRMPTKEEFDNLLAKCDVKWIDGSTEKYNNTTVTGLLCTGKGAYSSNSVFLPAAGGCDDRGVYSQSYGGYYWSSTPDGSGWAYFLYFESIGQLVSSEYRYYGYSVRPVLNE